MLAGICLSGCRTPHRLEVSEKGAPQFKRFRAEYEFDEPRRTLGRAFETDPDSFVTGSGASVEPVSWQREWSVGRLTIQCPHPSGDANVARVVLSLERDDGGRRAADKEVRVLVVPRTQVELLIADLTHSGFFDERIGSDDGSNLTIEIDKGRVEQAWHHDARFLDFAYRAMTRGKSLRSPRRRS